MSGSDLFGWDDDCYSMENSSDHKIEESVLSKFEKDRKKLSGNLTVHNVWESLTWFIDGKKVIPEDVTQVVIKGKIYTPKVKVRRGTYGDMGHTYSYVTKDLTIQSEFGTPISLEALLDKNFQISAIT